MSKHNDLFSNLLTGFLSSDFLMKFLDVFNSENVSVKSDDDSVVVNVSANVDDDDEYDRFVRYLLTVISAHECDHDYMMKITMGDRNTDVYKYSHEKGEFEFEYTENKEKKENNELPVVPENNKPVPAGVKYELKENNGIEEIPFAQWLKCNVQEDIDNGMYELDSEECLFDVDEAIDTMLTIYDTDLYDIITDDKNNLVGIEVQASVLCDIIEPCESMIDVILENEQNNIAEFIKRCIFELGFSNVVPETVEDDENVSCTEDVDKGKNIIFKLYF